MACQAIVTRRLASFTGIVTRQTCLVGKTIIKVPVQTVTTRVADQFPKHYPYITAFGASNPVNLALLAGIIALLTEIKLVVVRVTGWAGVIAF